MVEVARTHKLQIMHVHYAIPFAAAAIMARQIAPELGLKVVTTLHGTDITLVGSSPSFKPVTRWSIEESDAVTAVSRYLRDETYRQIPVHKEIEVVYNFIDPDRHDVREPRCIPEKKSERQVTLMHISNFRALEARGRRGAHLRQGRREHGCAAGAGGRRPGVRADARAGGEARAGGRRCAMSGVVDDVAPLLKAADVLLLPSETESFGLVALEAMASGVPVVASDVGGLPEVVEHGVTGFLAPVGDVDAMAGLLPEAPGGLRRGKELCAGGQEESGGDASTTGLSCRSTRGSTSGPWADRRGGGSAPAPGRAQFSVACAAPTIEM